MSRYKKTLQTLKDNISRYGTTYYDNVPESNSDIFVTSQYGDRLDKLAHQFYGDSSLWWFIARVNNIKTMNVEPGTSLRIPVSTEFARGD